MAAINEYYPDEVLHPSVTLAEKLDEMGMSNKEFALRTGKPEKTIVAVLKGESSITPEMAIMFENITRIPASFWINKQARYNEYKARIRRSEDIENAKEWAKSFPYAEMAKYGWVEPSRNIEEKCIYLFEYFGISTHTAWNKLYLESELKIAAYASLKHTQEPHSISAWLRKGELQARDISAPEYNLTEFKKSLYALKELMANQPVNFFEELQHICLKSGVKVFYTPRLPKTPINGSTRWINNAPVIQLTARYKQNDRFWFTFFHEAGHIILHGKKYISLENINFSEADPIKEEQAHRFAESWTLTKEQENEILQNMPRGPEDIMYYAKKFKTHPAIIIGRFQHREIIPYSFGREFIEPIDLSNN
jgi:plasmid maintenance system antidote protein VapI/Zn-dependent peptidase ImmA (M78 family)